VASQARAIVPLQQNGAGVPVFAVPGHNGDVFCYRALAQSLGDDQPFFGLQPPGVDGRDEPLERVADLAAYFAAQIRAFQPCGPYVIAGFCAGGTVAFELAQQLVADGAEIAFIALFGCPYPTYFRRVPQLRERLAQRVAGALKHARVLATHSMAQGREYVLDKLRQRRSATKGDAVLEPVLIQRAKVENATLAAVREYTPREFTGRIKLFLPSSSWARNATRALQWRSAARNAEEYYGPESCTGDNMLLEPNAALFAELFRRSETAKS
jgi:thioesterase domain-containing protein